MRVIWEIDADIKVSSQEKEKEKKENRKEETTTKDKNSNNLEENERKYIGYISGTETQRKQQQRRHRNCWSPESDIYDHVVSPAVLFDV